MRYVLISHISNQETNRMMKIIKKPISITLYTDERVMKDGRFCKRLFVKALLLLISFASQMISYRLTKQLMNVNIQRSFANQSEPLSKLLVWPLSRSLAATRKIDVSFSSSGYLDVSVPRVPSGKLCIGLSVLKVYLSGFPHSDIHGSKDICSSPWLFAAYHVLHRLSVPRHPPCALYSLTIHQYIALY